MLIEFIRKVVAMMLVMLHIGSLNFDYNIEVPPETTEPTSSEVQIDPVVDTSPPIESEFDGSIPNNDILKEMQNDPYLLGVFYVPSVNMSPMHIYTPREDADLQRYADLPNAGYGLALYDFYNRETKRIEIGDHNNQCFKVNDNIKVGTIGYINRGDVVVTIECISVTPNCPIPEYDASIVSDDNIIATLTCDANGTRLVHRWVVVDGMSFEQLWDEVASYFFGQRNSA